ncbi:unnamed protein product [Blepharisma stoltei]|uniref:UBA domain-containing protein n=1 Tax=Blepharisma stoltei TaxID=1481888 RepID=A0AAU9KLS1_9CILI|nr:unnamed protein product [Blepharisma stoltei]
MVSIEPSSKEKEKLRSAGNELLEQLDINLEVSIGIENSPESDEMKSYRQEELENHENYQNLSEDSIDGIQDILKSPCSPAFHSPGLKNSFEIIHNDLEPLEYEEFEFHIESDEDKEDTSKQSVKEFFDLSPKDSENFHSISEIPLNFSVDNAKEVLVSNQDPNENHKERFLDIIRESISQGIQTDPAQIEISNIPSVLMQSIRDILKEELQKASNLEKNPQNRITFIAEPLKKPIIQLQHEKRNPQPIIQADCSGAKYKRPTGKEIQKKVLQLKELGFKSPVKAISALAKTNYDVMMSVEILLNN